MNGTAVINNEHPLYDTEKSKRQSSCQKFSGSFLLPLMFMIAMVIGVSLGFIIRHVDPSVSSDPRRLMYLGFPGELMIAILKEIILPLVVTSLIAGVGALPVNSSGKLGWRMVAYYLCTTFIAVVVGIILVVAIQPGYKGQDVTVGVKRSTDANPVDSLLDLIRNLFPKNLVEACLRQIKTVATIAPMEILYHEGTLTFPNRSVVTFNATYDEILLLAGGNLTSSGAALDIVANYTHTENIVEDIGTRMAGGTNTLGVIVAAVVVGVMLSRMGRRAQPLLHLCQLAQDVVIGIIRAVIWVCPVGIVFLLASKIVAMKDPAQSFTQLAWYMLTVIAGLGTHFFVVLPLLYVVLTRRNPFRLMGAMSPALLLAISTASSSATMSVTLRCLSERARVNPLVASFMVPVGATINMDGTALYEAVASIFIAQYNDITLSFGQIIVVSITSTAAAIGAAGVPEAGLVTMLIVLTAVGLPTEDVGLIYAVDWLLDRLRTCLNVWGDSVGTAIIDHRLMDELDSVDTRGVMGGVLTENGPSKDDSAVDVSYPSLYNTTYDEDTCMTKV